MTVLALDHDGTIADDDGNLRSGAEQKLPLYRETHDVQVVVCTGCRLSRIQAGVRDFADAIVAENGGVIDWGDKIEIGEPVTETVRELVEFHFPEHQYDIRRTMAFIECHPDNFPGEFLDEITASGYELVRNNATASIKPPEYDKANGLRHAMAYRHGENEIIAAGDSENDIPMLQFADVALTPSNGDGEITETRVGSPFYRGDEPFFDGIEDRLHELITSG